MKVVHLFKKDSIKLSKIDGGSSEEERLWYLLNPPTVSNAAIGINPLRRLLKLPETHEDVFTESVDQVARECENSSAVRINLYDPNSPVNKRARRDLEGKLRSIDPSLIDKLIQPYGHFIFSEMEPRDALENPEIVRKHLGKGFSVFARNKALQNLALGLIDKKYLPSFFGIGIRQDNFPKASGFEEKFINPEGHEFIVAKPNVSSHGIGVAIDSPDNLRLVPMPDLMPLDISSSKSPTPFMIQSYVEQKGNVTRATDMRVVLIKDPKTQNYRASGMIRYGEEGSKVSNLGSGGRAIGITGEMDVEGELERKICDLHGVNPETGGIPKEILDTSIKYAEGLQLPVTGFDYGISENGPVLFEVNFNPGALIHYHNGHTRNDRLSDFIDSHNLTRNLKMKNYQRNSQKEVAAATLLKSIGRCMAFGFPYEDITSNLGINVNEVYGSEIAMSEGGKDEL